MHRTRALAAVSAFVALGLLSCSSTGPSGSQLPASGASPSSPENAATDSASSCLEPATESTIQSLLKRLNEGDTDGAAKSFAALPAFQWYSATSSAGHYVTYDPSDLPDHFAERHSRGESFELASFQLNPPPVDGNISFQFEIQWANPDTSEATELAFGKGAARCSDGEIIVWSLAVPPAGPGPVQTPGD